MVENNRLFDEFDTKKLEDFSADNLDSFRDQVFITPENIQLVNDLLRFGYMNNQFSSSGPISRSLKLYNFRYTSTGDKKESLGLQPGEVWKINTLSMAEQGSGTATISFALFEPANGDQSFFAVHSTTSQEPVPVTSDSFPEVFITSDFQLNNLVNNTGGTAVEVDLTLVRVR